LAQLNGLSLGKSQDREQKDKKIKRKMEFLFKFSTFQQLIFLTF
jgi:hypothetical protein